MKNLYFFWGLILLTCGCTTCEDDDFIEQFDIQLSISPEQKSYSINDTLWLTSKFNYTLDFVVLFPFSMQVDGSEVEFVTDHLLDTASVFINHGGTNSNIFFNYGCPFQVDSFDFKLGIIFKEKGMHLLQPHQKEIFYHASNITCDSLQENSFFQTNIGEVNYFFDVMDGNFDLYLQAPDLASEENILNKKAFILNVE